jgi:curved DNA-binding protein CbpA
MDHYATLGVDKAATLPEIRAAYHKLALQHHPDRNKGSAESEQKFREISSAYTVLSDERQRRQYDHERARPAPRPAPGGTYTPPPAPNDEGWIPRKKYEAVKNSYFYQYAEKRKAQNQQRSYNPGFGLVVDPFEDQPSNGLQAPIELGKPVPIVGITPILGTNLNMVHGAFGSLPGAFFFRKST